MLLTILRLSLDKAKFYLFFILLVFSSSIYAQEKVRVKGKVFGETENALSAVSVSITGETTATTTNASGEFDIQVPINSILKFSSVGYDVYEFKADKNYENLVVRMTLRVVKMEEVVIVGYGTIKKRDFTGASSSVSAKVISETPPTTLENALQGRMAGVNITNTSAEPGGGINIQVRGVTSLSGGNQPLYVIDGVPQYNDNTRSAAEFNGLTPTNALASLNPSDIESVEVLKDASSASIYGSRGANGVIMITTKKGRAGKGTVAFNYYTLIAERPKIIPLANAKEFATHMNLATTNRGGLPPYDGAYEVTTNGQDSIYFPSPSELGTGTNWQKEIFRSAITQNFQLTLSGGNDGMRYLISGNYLRDQGVVKFSKYQKGSIRANIEARLNNRLTANIYTSYATDLNDRAESTNSSAAPSGTSPGGVILKSFLASPALSTDNLAYRTYLMLLNRGAGSGLLNPLFDLSNTINQRRYNIFQTTMDLVYKFTKDISFTVRGAYNNGFSGNDMYWGYETSLGYDRGQKTNQSTWKTTTYINENFVTFNRNRGDYTLNAVAGASFQFDDARGSQLGGELLSVPSDNGLYLLPLYQNRSIPVTNYAKSFLVSAFGRVAFSYKSRYLLTLTGRSDASSKFAENKKWAYFPSIGLGWTFSEESFFGSLREKISNAKVRFSYGTSGNQAISPFQSLASLTPISYGFISGAVTGIVTNTSENKDLSWETTTQMDLGLDLGFRQNKYRVSVDVYRKKTEDLLQYKNIPAESGFATILTNFGSIQNEGIEFDFAGEMLKRKSFTWELTFNYSYNKNKVLDLGEGVDFYNASSGNADYTHRLRVGSSLGDFWGFQTAGLLTAEDITKGYPTFGGSTFEGDLKFRDVNNDNKITDEDKVKLGNAIPEHTIGFSNNFTYKNWTLNVFVTGVFGNQILNQNLIYSTYGSYFGVPSRDYINDFWTPENKDAYYPRPSASAVNNVTSDRLIQNGSYVRLKTVSLRYNFSKTPAWLSRMQLFLTSNNLYTFTKYNGYDPEVSGYGQNILTPGIDLGSYPRTRSWTIGLDIQF